MRMAEVLNSPSFRLGFDPGLMVPKSRRTKPVTIGTIYFIGPEAGIVKIGFTNDLPTRLKRLQMGSPVPLFILATAEGRPMTDEGAYHRRFIQWREHGEWFLRTVDVDAEIALLNAPKGGIHADKE